MLTLLGIILSTMTLIAVMSVIRGMDVYIANSASTMGNDGFRVLRVAFGGLIDAKKFYEAQQRNPQLSRAEFDFIKNRLTLVKESGVSGTRIATASYSGDNLTGVALQGNTSNAAAMSNTQVDLGRFINDLEVDDNGLFWTVPLVAL